MNTLAAAGSSPDSVIAVIAGLVAIISAYWIPAITAWARQVPNRGSVIVVNLFLGWTIIGWIVAMAMAMRDPHPAA